MNSGQPAEPQPVSACMRDYGKRFNVVDGIGSMAEFTDVTPATALGWLEESSREALPKGTTLLKLRTFLSLIGYEVAELKDLPNSALKLAELIALNVFNVKEVAQRLGYVDDKAIYRQTLQVAVGLSAQRADRVDRFVRKYDEVREEAKRQWCDILRDRGLLLVESAEKQSTSVTVSTEMPLAQGSRLVFLAFFTRALELTAIAAEQAGLADSDEQKESLEVIKTTLGEERLQRFVELLSRLLQR
jgi:hypothetical protein